MTRIHQVLASLRNGDAASAMIKAAVKFKPDFAPRLS